MFRAQTWVMGRIVVWRMALTQSRWSASFVIQSPTASKYDYPPPRPFPFVSTDVTDLFSFQYFSSQVNGYIKRAEELKQHLKTRSTSKVEREPAEILSEYILVILHTAMTLLVDKTFFYLLWDFSLAIIRNIVLIYFKGSTQSRIPVLKMV